MIQHYLDQWQKDGPYWGRESPGTPAQRRQADELFPQVLERLQELAELDEHTNPRRIWDYCVGNFGSDPVAEIVDEL